jgi:alkyl hydroperoxide reductase subunit AhpF
VIPVSSSGLLTWKLGVRFNSFSTIVISILQVSGRAPKEKQAIIDQIKGLEGNYNFETYVSLTCHLKIQQGLP